VGTCKPCANIRVSKWYSDNRSRRQLAANERNQKRKALVVEYFGNVCHDCKQPYPQCVYHFHHVNPKEKDVNPSVALAMSEDKMWRELRKCVMLCANCHMIRHHGSEGKEAVNATTH
jgi:hypothetical protein